MNLIPSPMITLSTRAKKRSLWRSAPSSLPRAVVITTSRDASIISAPSASAGERRIGRGYTDFLSGGSRGFDLTAAEIVLYLRETYPWIRLIVVCPWNGQADKWEAADQERWRQVLEASDRVAYVSDRYDKGVYYRRNAFLVDNANLLLACYNGDPYSGTGRIISYAHRKSISVRILTPEKRRASA